MNDKQHELPRSKYFSSSYESKSRFISYWRQIKEIIDFNPKNILEIGLGNGMATSYLKRVGYEVTTADINKRLEPDVVCSVTNLPFEDDSFDVILCAEVLEHIPYEEFAKALKEIHRVARRGAVLSLPHWGVSFYFGFKIPFLRKMDIFVKAPIPRRHAFDGEHYWEIGKLGLALRKVKKDIRKQGFQIAKEINLFEDPAHRFFILKK
jgi:ubiquinone/menaquinone biosynthesis C-methylase UbiE